MNRQMRWLVFPAVLLAGLLLVSPQNSRADWGYHGYYGPSVSYYGGYYAPYRVYPPLVVPAPTFGYYTPYNVTPYSVYYYGYHPYGRSFYGPRTYWFGTYGW